MTHQVGVKGWSTTITFISGCAVFTCLQVELERSTSSWQLVSFQRTHNFLHHPREPNASNMLEANLYLSPTIINSKTPKKSQKSSSNPIPWHPPSPQIPSDPIRSQAQKPLPPWQVPVRPWPPTPCAQPASQAAPLKHSRCARGKVSRNCLVP
jgi:hypothetical protein